MDVKSLKSPDTRVSFGFIYGKCSATTLNLYRKLYGFMSVAGVLGLFTYKRGVGDANSMLSTGQRRCENNVSNTPEEYGYLYIKGEDDWCVSQDFFATGGAAYTRRYVVSTKEWSAWKRVDNFGCNTLGELAAALKPKLGLS